MQPLSRPAIAGLLLLASAPARATFETLPTGTVGQPVGSVEGSAIQFWDTLFIPQGPVFDPPDPLPFNRYTLPGNFTLLNSQSTRVVLSGGAIGQNPAQNFEVGTLFDKVLLDTSVNRLVFNSRLILDETVAGLRNVYEVNNILRRGFTGHAGLARIKCDGSELVLTLEAT